MKVPGEEDGQVTSVSYNDWVIYALVFLLGLVIGMALMAGGKWKRRYKEEVRLRKEDQKRHAELEAENKRLVGSDREKDSLRQAAARDEARQRTDRPGPL
jgi:uncharacterized membrane-anchored protein YhcB (DUF1043 family)